MNIKQLQKLYRKAKKIDQGNEFILVPERLANKIKKYKSIKEK